MNKPAAVKVLFCCSVVIGWAAADCRASPYDLLIGAKEHEGRQATVISGAFSLEEKNYVLDRNEQQAQKILADGDAPEGLIERAKEIIRAANSGRYLSNSYEYKGIIELAGDRQLRLNSYSGPANSADQSFVVVGKDKSVSAFRQVAVIDTRKNEDGLNARIDLLRRLFKKPHNIYPTNRDRVTMTEAPDYQGRKAIRVVDASPAVFPDRYDMEYLIVPEWSDAVVESRRTRKGTGRVQQEVLLGDWTKTTDAGWQARQITLRDYFEEGEDGPASVLKSEATFLVRSVETDPLVSSDTFAPRPPTGVKRVIDRLTGVTVDVTDEGLSESLGLKSLIDGVNADRNRTESTRPASGTQVERDATLAVSIGSPFFTPKFLGYLIVGVLIAASACLYIRKTIKDSRNS